MSPPCRQLTWDEVVEYAFLADFDLLRDSRKDIRTRPWAQPANRVLMDEYFKIERAREEIDRLNIEIRRIITHIEDEENYLLEAEEQSPSTELSFFIHQYRLERTRFSDLHLRRFSKLGRLPGFTGVLEAGEPVDRTLRGGQPAPILSAEEPPIIIPHRLTPPPQCQASLSDDDTMMDIDTPACAESIKAINSSAPRCMWIPHATPARLNKAVRPPIIYGADGLCSNDTEGDTDDGGARDIDAEGDTDDDDVEYLVFAITDMILAVVDK
jgi:hypothetical protein